MRSNMNGVIVVVLLYVTGPLASPLRHATAAESPQWSAPALERSVSVREGRTDRVLTFDALIAELNAADVVFLGEQHNDETTHRVELAVYERLLARRSGHVALALEMFERDVQKALDDYIAGQTTEPEFRAAARPWGNYATAYRSLIECAKRTGAKVLASNFPRPLQMRLRMARQGAEREFTALRQQFPDQVPARLLPNSPAYWRRVDNAIRGHLAMMRQSTDEAQRLYSTQSLWDNTMGETCAHALDQDPGRLVLHINGGFHSAYWDGTVHQLKLRKPKINIKTVAIVPVSDPAVARQSGKPVADFVVFAEARATSPNEGTLGVYVQRELKYKLHLPDKKTAKPVPLLLWLSDDGFVADDGLELWKERLGEEVAIAVIEAPYRETQEDFGVGGRWYWPSEFTSDVGTLVGGVERIWAYLVRHYPIDPNRVCLAGEGTGATVAAAVAVLTDRIQTRAVALQPRRYAKLKDFPLPLPELMGDEPMPERSLRVLDDGDAKAWWTPELAQYTSAGVPSQLEQATDDPWGREYQEESLVRDALGLRADAAPHDGVRHYILVPEGMPRARHWARLQALRAASSGQVSVAVVAQRPQDANARELPITIAPSALAEGNVLPRCPGPFGGTTVLVLAGDLPQTQVDAWVALEKNDPLARTSRFHRLRIVTGNGDRTLAAVLDTLRSQGRKNVLIIPAVFCADPAWMRRLRQQVRRQEDQMTLHWLPGLGGCKLPIGETTAAKQADREPVRHELAVVLDPREHRISVTDRVHLPAALRKIGASFELRRAFKISNSSVPLTATARPAETHSATRYTLRHVPKDEMLTVQYQGKVDFGLSEEKEQYTRGFRETRGILGPEGVFLDGTSGWVPRFNDDLIGFKMDVTAPSDWQVISQGNGDSASSPGHARWDSHGLMEQVYLVGGPLKRYCDAAGMVETLVYLHDTDEALARKYLDATGRYLEMYRRLIGPYPYGKFALVENFWETGYGMPSFTLLGRQVIRFPFIISSSYPHEILHNWWGNSVFVDYQRGNWCEGLTAYLADHLMQEQRGKDADYRRNTLQKYRDYVRAGRDFPLVEFRNRHSAATEAVGYGKSLMLFHMLRRRVGDDAFRKSLADFYRQYRGRRASFDDLRSVFATATSQDLTAFFNQWITRTGAPKLALSDVKVRRADDSGHVVSGTLRQLQTEPVYDLQVPITLRAGSAFVTWTVPTRQRATHFEKRVSETPTGLFVDPQFDLFRLLDPRETPPAIGQIFGEPRILAVLPAREDAKGRAKYETLVKAWTSDDHAIETKLDAAVRELPDDRSAWLFGRDNRVAKKLFSEWQTTDGTSGTTNVLLGAESVTLAKHCIIAVRRHPRNMEKAIGWIVVDPPAAAAGLARKLPHYGKYSYLAFTGAEPTNAVKGQTATTNSPLVVDLRPHATTPLPAASPKPRPALIELPPIFSRAQMTKDLQWLAASQREGRGLGTPQLTQSAKYIAQQMEAAGLRPGGDQGSWFQRFTVAKGPRGRPAETINVVGVLPGKRADWKTQSVVLGAHYDHLGRGWPDVRAGNEGKIHPGADDNASGVAVLLALARNLAAQGGGSRNVVFVAFSAEECGRLGSKYYVAHPRFPLRDVRAMVNLDTVGRLFDKPIAVHGTSTSDQWQHIFRGCGYVTGIACTIVPGNDDASDQMSFIERGIPAVQVFTGAHADYHRPSDTPDKIDYAGLVKVAVFTKEAVAYLVERAEPLVATIGAHRAAPSSSQTRKVMFGTVPAFGYQGPGVKIDQLVAGSPAQRAGLKPGDVLSSVDGKELADLRAFSELLKKLRPGQKVTATVLRSGKSIRVEVVLAPR